MTPHDNELVQSLLQMAEQSLAEAGCLEEHGLLRGTINRMYYASFYAVSALMESNGLDSSKHSGIRGLFNKLFVHPGLVSPEQGIFYNQIYKMRHLSDYMMNVSYDAGDVEDLLSNAHKFVLDIKLVTLGYLEKTKEE